MLRTLLESNAPRQRRRGSTAASIAVHTAVIGGAIVATASAKPDPTREPDFGQRPPIYVPVTPTAPRPANPAEPRTSRQGGRPIADLGPPHPPRLPVFRPLSVPDASTDVDPAKLLAADSTWGDRRGPLDRRPGGGSPVGLFGDEPATAATVDRVAALVAPPRPRYPDQLRAAGVTGRVVVRLVVDTTGRVESSSVVIREASHDLFAQAVRAVLPSLRFTPAEVGGRKVRMLVDLPFEFRLTE